MQTLAIPEIKAVKAGAKSTPVSEFVKLVQQGIDAWNEAGKRLVVALGIDPGFFKKIRADHPEISIEMLIVFERIGRKQIYAPLLADNSLGARALLEMPYEAQEKYAKGMIDIIRNFKTGEVVKKRVSELTRAEVKQVFGFESVLTPKQQMIEYNDRFENSRPDPISRPPVTPAQKRVEKITCVQITIENGKLSFKEVPESFRAQQVRFEKPLKGPMTAEILIYRNL